MERSESVTTIGNALLKFHKEVEAIKKNEENPFFKSKYADLSVILESIKQPLQNAGLAFAQFPEGLNSLTTILIETNSGEFMSSTHTMPPVKEDPQSRGSAMTYMRRYALSAILGLNTVEDNDGNEATNKEDAQPTNTQNNGRR